MDFGQTLYAVRIKHGPLAQNKLAEKAGFNHSFVSRLEKGTRTPTRDTVEKLADALDASDEERDKLLASAGFIPVGGLISLQLPELLLLDNAYRKATDHVRRKVRPTIGLLLDYLNDKNGED